MEAWSDAKLYRGMYILECVADAGLVACIAI